MTQIKEKNTHFSSIIGVVVVAAAVVVVEHLRFNAGINYKSATWKENENEFEEREPLAWNFFLDPTFREKYFLRTE